LPKAPGVLVINDWLPLAMCSVRDAGHMVVNVTHADSEYYYGLAEMHEEVIDCFVAYTEYIRNRLLELLPHRQESIFLLPYGVLPPERPRQPKPGPLRLLYVGRLSRAKGIFDLPQIDAKLSELGVSAEWSIQGTGPDEAALKRAWGSHRVRWLGRQAMADVLQLYRDHDVLVMPSRSEGLPVALLEAASAGVVPVVSDLPTGIPEVVEHGTSGYRPAPGDIEGFARAIGQLAEDREGLEKMSARVRQSTIRKFDIRTRARGYQDLYARWRELRVPRTKRGHLHYGSRLDKPWMPNSIVQLLRTTRQRLGARR
jgi:glycosyltransferase involved in cell wall biosynthesis